MSDWPQKSQIGHKQIYTHVQLVTQKNVPIEIGENPKQTMLQLTS